MRDARLVFDAHDRDLRFVARERDAGNDGLFHGFIFLVRDQRALRVRLGILKRRQHAELHLVLAREFDGADLQHLRSEARHFQHFLERHRIEAARFGHDARIGRIDAIDVRVDLAFRGAKCRCERNTGRVGASAPEGSDVAIRIHALESGDDDDRSIVEVSAHRRLVDRQDSCLGERAVGQHADLAAGVASRLETHLLQRNCEEPDRHLLAGRRDHVELARIGMRRQFLRQRE